MMRRSSDRPSTVPEALRSTRVVTDELARQNGRGSQALRNDAGHVITLDPSSVNPVLRPQTVDGDYVTGMQFDAYGARVVNPIYGNGNGDLTANAIATQMYVYANGYMHSDGPMSTNGGFTSNNGAGINGQINLAGNIAMGYYSIYCGNIYMQALAAGDIGGVNGNFSANVVGPRFIATVGLFGPVNPSERRLKTETGTLNDPLGTVRKLRPAAWRWTDPSRFGLPESSTEALIAGEHIGVYVDELAEADPRAVRTDPNGDVGYEDRALMAYLTGAVQKLADERDALSEKVDALTARLDALESAA